MTYDDGNTESYTYYPAGQVEMATQVIDGVTEVTSYEYDLRDRLTKETKPNGDSIEYTYDLAGNKLSVTTTVDTVSEAVGYTYDNLNRLKTVADGDLNVTTYGYDSVGNRASISHPNGLVTSYTYDSLNRLTDIVTRDAGGSVVSSYGYELGVTGRRDRITEGSGRVTDYGYDDLYRLVSEDVTDAVNGNYSASFVYGNTGNRESETINGVTTAYSYDDNDRLETKGSVVYTYDNNGSRLTETDGATVKSYVYDARNKMVEMTDTAGVHEYSYDIRGIRDGKTDEGVTTEYLIDHNQAYAQVLHESDGVTEKSYVFGDDLLSLDDGSGVKFYHYDGLGSTRGLSDLVAVETDSYDYAAFGELLNSSGTTDNDFLFTGEMYDSGLGLYNLRARYYDQGVGGFTSFDEFQGMSRDPITLHKYLYANNRGINPVSNVDPSGYFSMQEVTTTINIVSKLTTTGIRVAHTAAKVEALVQIPFIIKDIRGFIASGIDRELRDAFRESQANFGSVDVEAAVQSLLDHTDDLMTWTLAAWTKYLTPRAAKIDRFVIYLPQAPVGHREIPFTSRGKYRIYFAINNNGRGRLTGVGVGFKNVREPEPMWRMDLHRIHSGHNEASDFKYIVDRQFHYHVIRPPR